MISALRHAFKSASGGFDSTRFKSCSKKRLEPFQLKAYFPGGAGEDHVMVGVLQVSKNRSL